MPHRDVVVNAASVIVSTSKQPRNSRNTARSGSSIGIGGGDDDINSGLGVIKGASHLGADGRGRVEEMFSAGRSRASSAGRGDDGAIVSGDSARRVKNSGGGPVDSGRARADGPVTAMTRLGGGAMVIDVMMTMRARGDSGGPARRHVGGSTVDDGATRMMVGGSCGLGRGKMRVDVMVTIMIVRGSGMFGHASSPRTRARNAKRLPAAGTLSAAWLHAYGAWASDGRAPDFNPRSPGLLGLRRTESTACLRRSLRSYRLAGGPLLPLGSSAGRRLLARDSPSARGCFASLGALRRRFGGADALTSLPPSVQFQIPRRCGAVSLRYMRLRSMCHVSLASALSLGLIDAREVL